MSKTKRLVKGQYAFSSHTLLLDGHIAEIFVGKWESHDGHSRRLWKFPEGTNVDGGELMCFLQLKKPISIDDYRPIHRPNIHPILTSYDAPIKAVLMSADAISTIPDGM